jgi:MFS-type transporter involved in bile tolerance (Atg22 family)
MNDCMRVGVGFLKFHLFESDRTTINIQINLFFFSPSQSHILLALLFLSVFDVGDKFILQFYNTLMKEV